MGRFYFHLASDGEITPDEDGCDLPDLSAARGEAFATARELLADAIRCGKQRVPEALVIADASGQTIETIPLKEVLPAPFR